LVTIFYPRCQEKENGSGKKPFRLRNEKKRLQREIMFAHEVKLYMRDIPLPAAKNRKNGISVQISEAEDLTKMIPRRNTGR